MPWIGSQHLGDLEGVQSAVASSNMGVYEPSSASRHLVSAARPARCRLVVQIAAGKQVALACRAVCTKFRVAERAEATTSRRKLVVGSVHAVSPREPANIASTCCLCAMQASCVSTLRHSMSWLTFLLSVSDSCALYRSHSGLIGMVSR